MGTSGNPAKKAAQKKASAVSAFKKRTKAVPLPLPSGLVCQAKRVELKTFILQGDVPNPLMGIVSEALEKGQKAKLEEMVGGVEEGNIDLDQIREMYDMVNRIVIESFVEPKVHPDPTQEDVEKHNAQHPDEPVEYPSELIDDDLLYVSEIDDEDKMFVWQWATGGTSDVETFRKEAGADMDALAKIQGAQPAAE